MAQTKDNKAKATRTSETMRMFSGVNTVSSLLPPAGIGVGEAEGG